MGSGIKIKCMKCDEVIQSMHRHDYVNCECGAIAIDGGDSYTKVTGHIWDIGYPNEDNSEYKPMAYKEIIESKEEKKEREAWDTTLMDGLDDWDCSKWDDIPVGYKKPDFGPDPKDMLGCPRIEGDD